MTDWIMTWVRRLMGAVLFLYWLYITCLIWYEITVYSLAGRLTIR